MIPIELLYDAYLSSLEEAKNRKSKQFHASGAGRCFKLHQFEISDRRPISLEPRTKRLLRLGTIVGDDIETGIKKVWNSKELQKHIQFPIKLDGELLTQVKIEIQPLNVVGTLDIVRIFNNRAEIVDLKTTASYKWKKMFGRRRETGNMMYEKQVTTYAIGLMRKNQKIDKVSLALYYYNKDNSEMKSVPIVNHYDETIMYWEQLNDVVNTKLTPGDDYGVPFQSWECNYCQYSNICNSPFIKKGAK